jgi:ethanolamine ammonia-lyase large subunit
MGCQSHKEAHTGEVIMHRYTHVIGTHSYVFADLRTLLAKATPARSGDHLAGLAAGSAEERVAAQMALAALPLLRRRRGHAPDHR